MSLLAWCRQRDGSKKHDDSHSDTDDGLPLPSCARGCLTALAGGHGEQGDSATVESDKAERPLDEDTTHTFVLRQRHATPKFLHNPFILSGYRVYFSTPLAWRSLFRWHNETVNIWTHLGPALFFTARFLWAMLVELPRLAQMQATPDSPEPVEIDAQDYAWLAFFYTSVIGCFYMSAAYHLLGCVSFATHSCMYRCDISGILLLIAGSYLPALHYAFRCRPTLRHAYMGIVLSLVGTLVVMFQLPRCATRRLHALRVGALVSTIAFAVVPAAHWILVVLPTDFPSLPLPTFLVPLCAMLGAYALGFVFYSRHIPECWSPGRFDLAFQSHNWWHLLVASAAAIWDYELWAMLHRKGMAAC